MFCTVIYEGRKQNQEKIEEIEPDGVFWHPYKWKAMQDAGDIGGWTRLRSGFLN